MNQTRGDVAIYQTPDGVVTLEVRLEKETIWLDAHQMGTLFERDRSVIVKHIRNVYKTGELSPDSTCAKNAQVAKPLETVSTTEESTVVVNLINRRNQ